MPSIELSSTANQAKLACVVKVCHVLFIKSLKNDSNFRELSYKKKQNKLSISYHESDYLFHCTYSIELKRIEITTEKEIKSKIEIEGFLSIS